MGGRNKHDYIAFALPICNNQFDGDRAKLRGGWEKMVEERGGGKGQLQAREGNDGEDGWSGA